MYGKNRRWRNFWSGRTWCRRRKVPVKVDTKLDPKIIQLAARSPFGVWLLVFVLIWLIGGAGIYIFFQKKIGSLDLQNLGLGRQIRETQNFMSNLPDIDGALKEHEELLKKIEEKTLKQGE